MHELLFLVPKNILSRFVGSLVSLSLPRFLSRAAVRIFAKRYGINISEAEQPLESYSSIQALFTRRLKDGVRPIGKGVVSPVDALCSQAGGIERGTLLEVKGWSYRVEELLADKELADKFQDGTSCVLYLAPPDYHRIHSPIDGRVISSIHVPGKLWPVNEWAVRRIKNLFVKNERLVTTLDTAIGLVAVIKVGATNVGSIEVSYDDLRTNGWFRSKAVSKRVYQDIHLKAGEELGVFRLGSTVVLLFERRFAQAECSKLIGRKCKMGQQLFEL